MDITITHAGGKKWKIAKRIYHKLPNNESIVIPIGFKTDLATSPTIMWGFFPPYSDFLPAAIVHDWLYANKYVPNGIVKGYDARLFADKEMLRLSMIHNNFKGFKGVKKRFGNRLRFTIVRCLGWIYWYDIIK